MRIAESKLRAGEWIHMFPEARVVQLERLGRLKWGVGRLVAENENVRLLPFVHTGLVLFFS